MSDFFAPSYWYGGGPDFSGLANAQASQAQTNNFNAQQANTLATANAFNPWANSGGSFGAQPAYYAGLGAAYGRSTGGFRGGAGNPSGSVQRGPDLPDISPAQNPFISSRGHTTNPGRGIMGYSGGIGSDAARVPFAVPTKAPRVPTQDWNTTFNNMTAGNSYNPYALGSPSWYPSERGGGRNDLAAMMAAAQDRIRAGQGWTIAQQPPAASQGTLTSRINQSIYDLGNAGTAYGQHGLDIAGRGTLTPEDMAIPHAYPPSVRSYMNPNPGS